MNVTELPSPSAELRLGHCGPVMLSCFGGWPTPVMLKAISRAQLELSAQYPRMLSLSVIPAAPLAGTGVVAQPDGERAVAMKASVDIAKELEGVTAASAMVILSSGLLSVMVRTFMAGLSLVYRSSTELKTFKTLQEAEAWFATVKGAPPVPARLSSAVEAWLAGPPKG